MPVSEEAVRRRWLPVALGVALATLSFLAQRDAGLDLGDEGFVWYGAVWTARGDVPLRDFRSYDPGWYYWSAAWFRLLGRDGPVALRLGAAVVQGAALAGALLVLARALVGAWVLAAVGLLHALWMFRVNEVMNGSLALLAVAVGAAFLERPTRARHLLAGVFVGLAAAIGRNHGLYAALAFAVLLVLAPRPDPRTRWRDAGLWAGGIVAGYAPVLLMCAAVPGFAAAFLDSIAFWFRVGHTNLPRPVPWPWRDTPEPFALGVLFLLLPLFFAGVSWLAWRSTSLRSPALLAALAVGACYLHYTFARPDAFHVGRGAIHPFLVALAALLAAVGRRTLTAGALALVAVLSLAAAGPRHPLYERLRSPARYQPVSVGGDSLQTERTDAALIRAARRVKEEGGDVYVAFTVPGLYPVLDQRSPAWDTYPLLPETAEHQQDTIDGLDRRGVNRAIVCPWADVPNPSGFGFANTHRLIWTHLRTDWTAAGEIPAYSCRVLRRTRGVEAP